MQRDKWNGKGKVRMANKPGRQKDMERRVAPRTITMHDLFF